MTEWKSNGERSEEKQIRLRRSYYITTTNTRIANYYPPSIAAQITTSH